MLESLQQRIRDIFDRGCLLPDKVDHVGVLHSPDEIKYRCVHISEDLYILVFRDGQYIDYNIDDDDFGIYYTPPFKNITINKYDLSCPISIDELNSIITSIEQMLDKINVSTQLLPYLDNFTITNTTAELDAAFSEIKS